MNIGRKYKLFCQTICIPALLLAQTSIKASSDTLATFSDNSFDFSNLNVELNFPPSTAGSLAMQSIGIVSTEIRNQQILGGIKRIENQLEVIIKELNLIKEGVLRIEQTVDEIHRMVSAIDDSLDRAAAREAGKAIRSSIYQIDKTHEHSKNNKNELNRQINNLVKEVHHLTLHESLDNYFDVYFGTMYIIEASEIDKLDFKDTHRISILSDSIDHFDFLIGDEENKKSIEYKIRQTKKELDAYFVDQNHYATERFEKRLNCTPNNASNNGGLDHYNLKFYSDHGLYLVSLDDFGTRRRTLCFKAFKGGSPKFGRDMETRYVGAHADWKFIGAVRYDGTRFVFADTIYYPTAFVSCSILAPESSHVLDRFLGCEFGVKTQGSSGSQSPPIQFTVLAPNMRPRDLKGNVVQNDYAHSNQVLHQKVQEINDTLENLQTARETKTALLEIRGILCEELRTLGGNC